MKFIYVILMIALLLVIFSIQGCSTAEQLKEHEFTNGCLVLEAGINLGYLNQEGKAEVCKLKCSPLLPDNFSYHYENQHTGCKVEVIGKGL